MVCIKVCKTLFQFQILLMIKLWLMKNYPINPSPVWNSLYTHFYETFSTLGNEGGLISVCKNFFWDVEVQPPFCTYSFNPAPTKYFWHHCRQWFYFWFVLNFLHLLHFTNSQQISFLNKKVKLDQSLRR